VRGWLRAPRRVSPGCSLWQVPSQVSRGDLPPYKPASGFAFSEEWQMRQSPARAEGASGLNDGAASLLLSFFLLL
jgi:hypothetical protein